MSDVGAREGLLRHLRRAWLGPAFRRSPHTVLVLSLRLAGRSGTDAALAGPALARTAARLTHALGEVGTVYRIGEMSLGLLLPARSVTQAERIAEAARAAVDRHSSEHPHLPVALAAGIAGLNREEDPTAALCLAEHCLAIAEAEPGSAIVTSADPRARQTRRRWNG